MLLQSTNQEEIYQNEIRFAKLFAFFLINTVLTALFAQYYPNLTKMTGTFAAVTGSKIFVDELSRLYNERESHPHTFVHNIDKGNEQLIHNHLVGIKR